MELTQAIAATLTEPADGGVARFPVRACPDASPCPVCGDCADDCANCVLCEHEACPHCAVPDLTPRTATMLLVAGMALAREVRTIMLSSARPVFMHHLAGAFDAMASALERGNRPEPRSLAEQLCLHLMIRYATDLSCAIGETLCANLPYSDYDYYFDRLYDTLLRDDDHQVFVEQTVQVSDDRRMFDFEGLAEMVSRTNVLFATFS